MRKINNKIKQLTNKKKKSHPYINEKKPPKNENPQNKGTTKLTLYRLYASDAQELPKPKQLKSYLTKNTKI